MKKKTLTIFSLIIITLMISSCGKTTEKKEIAINSEFKEEYESLNGQKNSAGKEHRKLKISKYNPFVYNTASDIVKNIEDKQTFYVYFGSAYCPWCRSVIEVAIQEAKANDIDKIYYVDIWDGDHKEILRDTYELDENGKVKLVKEGTEDYKKLLEYMGNVLSDYTLTDEDSNKVNVGEKRIMAPNFVYVEKGKAKKVETGISSEQKDARAKLTDKILEDEKEKFSEFFDN